MKSIIYLKKYQEGEVVYARENPGIKLVVYRFENTVYYCKPLEHPTQNDLFYFERDLIADTTYEN